MIKHIAMETALVLCDAVFSCLPQARPSDEALGNCKIISHRGEHDNRDVKENTLAAFHIAKDAGAWGIEFDIRWTRDLVPVVIHDPDTKRVFGTDIRIADVEFAQLRAQIPNIPSLEELVSELGGTCHFMLEIKEESFPQLEKQKKILSDILSPLKPGTDFHILALDGGLFDAFDIFPPSTYLPVAMTNTRAMSELALENDLAGLSGHYVLMNGTIRARHEETGQKIGPGFIRSRNSLYREINLGAEWIFTNDAVKLQRILAESTS